MMNEIIESEAQVFPREERDEVVLYSFDRELDGESDGRFYESEQDARRAAGNAYGATRIWREVYRRSDMDPEFDEGYFDLVSQEEL